MDYYVLSKTCNTLKWKEITVLSLRLQHARLQKMNLDMETLLV